MELKQKLYQMFILGFEGESLEGNNNLVKALKMGLGGVIFFTQNIKTEMQIINLIKSIKAESEIIPFLSIDQEGGRVERTENLFGGKKFLSMGKCSCDLDLIKNQTTQIAHLLNKLGFNLNFAPCIDVNTNPENPIIGERAFSDDAGEVIKCGRVVVDTYLENGIIPCTKHFPGHGDASVDSHVSLPEINLSLREMEDTHIRPFKEVFSPMIMVAHLHCPAFDKEKIPTSLSKNAIGYLRNKLFYEGLIITDDMVMGGVINMKDESFGLETALLAIRAGVNLLLYRNSFEETLSIIEGISEMAKSDIELQEKIEDSFRKIKNCKDKYILSRGHC